MKPFHYHPRELKVEGPKDQTDGIYNLPHPKIRGYFYRIVASTGLGWEHVSVTLVELKTHSGKKVLKSVSRCPTWAEMCFVKDIFWSPDECVVQYHPPMSEYVNDHEFCLHLWKPTGAPLPAPDAILVGSAGIPEILAEMQEKIPGYETIDYLMAIYYSPNKERGTDQWWSDIKDILRTTKNI